MSDDSLVIIALIGVGAYLYMQKQDPPVKSAGTQIGETAGTIAQNVGQEAQTIAKNIEEGWKDKIQPFFDTTVPNTFNNDVKPVFTQTIPNVFRNDVKPVFTQTIPNVIENKVVPFFNNVGGEIKHDAQKVENAFKSAGNKIKSFFHL
jgi:hypothetical protein